MDGQQVAMTPMTIDSRSMREAFIRRFGRPPKLFRAPGRVNVIGGHTDYNDGFVLPTTTGLYTWIGIAPRDDRILRAFSCRFDSVQEVDLGQISKRCDGAWFEYVKGVASVLEASGRPLRGADLVIDGDIPLGGGLSSSASLETALAFALLDGAGAEIDRAELARLCQRAETDFVGARCGIMDQFVISRCARGRAMMLDCRSLEFRLAAMPNDARLLIVDSGASHRLPSGEYNSRREECEQAISLLASRITQLSSLRDLELEQLENEEKRLGDRLYRRCRHVLNENQRVEAAYTALQLGDVAQLGKLITASHVSLRDDYEVSCAELDALVEIMIDCPGVYGARLIGGGFGGCALCLVDAPHLDQVIEEVRAKYAEVLGSLPWIHVVTAADPAGPALQVEPDSLPPFEVTR